jgi:putative membrane protein
MYGWHGGAWGIGAWIVLTLMLLLFWGSVVTVIVLLPRRPHATDGGGLRPPHHDAERILNERLARGEIDEVDFAARRAALRRPE